MNRRSFLGGLLGLAALPLAIPAAVAMVKPKFAFPNAGGTQKFELFDSTPETSREEYVRCQRRIEAMFAEAKRGKRITVPSKATFEKMLKDAIEVWKRHPDFIEIVNYADGWG